MDARGRDSLHETGKRSLGVASTTCKMIVTALFVAVEYGVNALRRKIGGNGRDGGHHQYPLRCIRVLRWQ